MIRLLLIVSILIISGCSEKPSQPGKTINDFRAPTLSGERYYLNQHKGKHTVCLFWSTDCVPCKQEMIFLNQLQSTHSNKPLHIITVCTDPENQAKAGEIIKSMNLSLPVLLDKGKIIQTQFKIKAVPTTVIWSGDFIETFRVQGYDDHIKSQLNRQVEFLTK